ncbi:MAG: FKBP-type peptidyl-prolyl cis-trans isomerase [Bacteroidetes bacterium]|nr:FKBP-type peptidyl-prolyl cis-trans isomerase [Bacteroidota bacterium]MDA1119020.1 FKBP-type peptidyl-prolyl cis-trans isomerase [Bacteroidota bacterium]
MKNFFLALPVGMFGLLATWSGCSDPNRIELFVDTLSIEQRMALEEDTIDQFIAEQEYDSVFITSSGVRIVPLTFVEGDPPNPGDILSVDYTGSFVYGAVFDTSHEDVAMEAGIFIQGFPYHPLVMNLGSTDIIIGWSDGLSYMKEGQKALLVIPSRRAFGSTARGSIAPNRILKFELTLVRIRRQ